MAERGGSRTLSRGLSVLRALGGAAEGATVAQISLSTGLDRAVLYRLLDTLTEEGFVVRDESRLFHLGVALVELGAKAGRGLEVTRLAAGGMHQLMELTREAVCLAVRDRDDLVVVDRVEPTGLFVRIGYAVGFRHQISMGAHGQALLAFMPGHGDGPVIDDAAREIIRRRGYAVSTDELEHGASGVAAPILDQHGVAVASLGVVAPTPRLPDPAVLGPRIAQTAMEISRRLGYVR